MTAILERSFPHDGFALGQCYRSQTGAALQRRDPYFAHAKRDRNMGQRGVIPEDTARHRFDLQTGNFLRYFYGRT